MRALLAPSLFSWRRVPGVCRPVCIRDAVFITSLNLGDKSDPLFKFMVARCTERRADLGPLVIYLMPSGALETALVALRSLCILGINSLISAALIETQIVFSLFPCALIYRGAHGRRICTDILIYCSLFSGWNFTVT
jgi:hypothetical protein